MKKLEKKIIKFAANNFETIYTFRIKLSNHMSNAEFKRNKTDLFFEYDRIKINKDEYLYLAKARKLKQGENKHEAKTNAKKNKRETDKI